MKLKQSRVINTIDQMIYLRIQFKLSNGHFKALAGTDHPASDHRSVCRWERISLEIKYCGITAT
jgi:hypothetical protein